MFNGNKQETQHMILELEYYRIYYTCLNWSCLLWSYEAFKCQSDKSYLRHNSTSIQDTDRLFNL
jgi:hypothetical protein